MLDFIYDERGFGLKERKLGEMREVERDKVGEEFGELWEEEWGLMKGIMSSRVFCVFS
ncbi:hypothetical protein [Bacillus pumilus]|uniref:hypothetical protein n=1 Tax=Bacillus pumilus TaxID=1408 RepID=UPI00164272E4|nr:hypothetical protein [Bacillus pumilus]